MKDSTEIWYTAECSTCLEKASYKTEPAAVLWANQHEVALDHEVDIWSIEKKIRGLHTTSS